MTTTPIPPTRTSITISPEEMREVFDIIKESKDKEYQLAPSRQQSDTAIVNVPNYRRESDGGFLSFKWLIDIENGPEEGNGICWCCCHPRSARNRKTKSTIASIIAWDTKHCKNLEDFLGLMNMVTKNADATIQGIQSVLSKLSFLNDPDPEYQKLSQIGSFFWLITYGIQYVLINDSQYHVISHPETGLDLEEVQFHPNPRVNTRIKEAHVAYEEVGDLIQDWIRSTVEFLHQIKDLRRDAVELIKQLIQKYRTLRNPFKLRPEVIPPEIILSKSNFLPDFGTVELIQMNPALNIETKSIRKPYSPHGQLDLRVQWSPVVILVQATPGSAWEVFSGIDIIEKVDLIAMFVQEPLRLLHLSFRMFKRSIGPATTIEQPGSIRTSNIMEVTCGLLHFTSTSNKFRKMILTEEEVGRLSSELEEFWITLDHLYEVTLKLSKLINETRDIVRSCSIYSNNFYNWKIRNPVTMSPASKEQEERMRKVTNLLKKTDPVEASKLYSVADFTTSRYQYVLQKYPITSHGIALKLECWDDFNNEPQGLIEGFVDKRKIPGTLTQGSKQSSRFVLRYRDSVF